MLRKQLKEIDKQMEQQRKKPRKIGSGSAGRLHQRGEIHFDEHVSKSKVLAENVFVTLDTTVRKVVLGNLPFLMSDTVGFIRKRSHQLVESFKSTLDETGEADIILHVVDISTPRV